MIKHGISGSLGGCTRQHQLSSIVSQMHGSPELMPQGLCTCVASARYHYSFLLTSFRSLLKCHLLREAFHNHPVPPAVNFMFDEGNLPLCYAFYWTVDYMSSPLECQPFEGRDLYLFPPLLQAQHPEQCLGVNAWLSGHQIWVELSSVLTPLLFPLGSILSSPELKLRILLLPEALGKNPLQLPNFYRLPASLVHGLCFHLQSQPRPIMSLSNYCSFSLCLCCFCYHISFADSGISASLLG